jgi:hypothetical protein
MGFRVRIYTLLSQTFSSLRLHAIEPPPFWGTPTHREKICWAAIMVAVAVAAPIPVPAPARASEQGVFLLACCELKCRWWMFASRGKEVGAEEECYKVKGAVRLVPHPGGFSMTQRRGVGLREHHVDSLTAASPQRTMYVSC